jgi:hypothetical protein
MNHVCGKIKEITGVDPLQPLPQFDIWYAPRYRVKDRRSKERRELAKIKAWQLMVFDKEDQGKELAGVPIRFCPFCGEDLAPVGTKITAHLAITNIYPFAVSASHQLDDIIKACDEYNLKHFGMEWHGKSIRQVPITVEFMVDDSIFDRPSVPIVHGNKK